MIKRKIFSVVLSLFFVFGFIIATASSSHSQGNPFPSYGSGSVQVRFYTNYFCPPCRGMEPTVEPILKNLIKRKVIRLTLVDVPFTPHAAMYARYFLYALKAKNSFDHALMVRNTLFEAAKNNQMNTTDKLETLFKSKRIPYAIFEPKPVFHKYNALIREDKINATPSCVIIKGGKKETIVGGADIINALKKLK